MMSAHLHLPMSRLTISVNAPFNALLNCGLLENYDDDDDEKNKTKQRDKSSIDQQMKWNNEKYIYTGDIMNNLINNIY